MATIVRKQPKGCPEPVYYYHEGYRVKVDPQNKGKTKGSGKSKVKTRDIYLGTASQILQKIQQGQCPHEVDKKEFGLVCAALDVAKEIGLVDVIDRCVPKRNQGLSVGQYILMGVLNKLTAPTSRRGIRDWAKKTVLPERLGIDPDLLTSQNFWDHFDLILPEKELKENKKLLETGETQEQHLFDDQVIFQIEEGIWANVLEKYEVILDLVMYDSTNFYTFLDPATQSYLARTGHNKHSRHNLRQVGMVLAMTRDASLPLLHALYHGRKSDAKMFPEAMTNLVERYLTLSKGAQNLTVVFDKGNNSKTNIEKALDLNIRVVGSLVPSHHRDLTGVRLSRYSLTVNGKPVFYTTKEVFGIQAGIAVVYNEATYRRQIRKLREKIKQLQGEISETFHKHKSKPKDEIEQKMQKLLHGNECARYITVEITGRRYKNLTCKLNRKAYYDKIKTFGKLIVFCNDTDISAEELVSLYGGKNSIEDQFKQLNDPKAIAFRPMYHWTDTKIKVYALICVLALLILQLMKHRADLAGVGMSASVLQSELKDILEVALIYSPSRVVKKISSLSSVQKELFRIFNLHRYAPRDTGT